MRGTPSFYDPSNAERWSYRPNHRMLAETAFDYARDYHIAPSAADKERVVLLVIDAQRDFCFPEGALFVAGKSGMGAIDDSRRLAEFIYRELPKITAIHPTLDTHEAFQIFSPMFWRDEKEQPLLPHDMIDSNLNIHRGGEKIGRALPAMDVALMLGMSYIELVRQVGFYAKQVESGGHSGKYMLYLWPEHCILGSEGHNLVGVIEEARLFHAYARTTQNKHELKGQNPLTENYSVFSPEVTAHWNGKTPIAERNQQFLDHILAFDKIIVAGQALSHCVQSSIDDLLAEIVRRDARLAQNVYILEDCMSAVVVPNGPDFTEQGKAALARFAAAGMHIVQSTTPMHSWVY